MWQVEGALGVDRRTGDIAMCLQIGLFPAGIGLKGHKLLLQLFIHPHCPEETHPLSSRACHLRPRPQPRSQNSALSSGMDSAVVHRVQGGRVDVELPLPQPQGQKNRTTSL